MLPPALDLEHGGNCGARPSREEVRQGVALWLREVAAQTGRTPLLYVTPEADEAYLLGDAPLAPLWLRSVFRAPALPPGAGWTLWQFANRGRISGVPDPVDLNVFHGDAASFLSL